MAVNSVPPRWPPRRITREGHVPGDPLNMITRGMGSAETKGGGLGACLDLVITRHAVVGDARVTG